MKLWSEKTRLAQGRPFQADLDMFYATLDAAFASTFGGMQEQDGAIYAQRNILTSQPATQQLDTEAKGAATFPSPTLPEGVGAIFTLTALFDIMTKSPFPRLAFWVCSKLPRFRRASQAKRDLIKEQIDQAVVRLENGENKRSSAIEDVLQQEHAAARAEGREPNYHAQHIYDEVSPRQV